MQTLRHGVVAIALVGCAVSPEDPAEIGGGGKADDASLEEGSETALAVLAVANNAPEDMLDESWGVGLDSRAVASIVAKRPFATLAKLDAVSYVTATQLTRLARFVRGELVDRSRPMTEQHWGFLLPEGKVSILEAAEYAQSDWPGMRIVEPSQRPIALASLDDSVRAHVTTADAWMRDNVNMDVMDLDGAHSVIGDPQLYWLTALVRESDGVVFGARLGYFQDGCDMPDADADVRRFDDRASAEAAGCQISDVNWQAHGTFDADASALRYDDAMEWSGY